MSMYDTSGDIKMVYDAAQGHGDLVVQDRDLERDPGLETAVIVSLFSNRRAGDGDALPDPAGSSEGWWADALNEDGDQIGSKLWLIGREKMVPATLVPRAQQYAKEALEWMLTDGVAGEIIAVASRYDRKTLKLDITIVRPEIERAEFFTYYFNWVEQIARRG
jgi:phage gp46-like protein